MPAPAATGSSSPRHSDGMLLRLSSGKRSTRASVNSNPEGSKLIDCSRLGLDPHELSADQQFRWVLVSIAAKPAVMLATAVIAMRLPSLWEPRWYSDEGTFTTMAWLHSQGFALYTGAFDTSPPGIYWLYEILLRAGADRHHIVVQLALLIAVLAAVECVYSLTRKWFGASVATVAAVLCAAGLSLPTLDGDLLNVEIAALPFFLGAMVAANHERARWAFVTGLLAAAALLIRPSYAVDCLAVLFLLISQRYPIRRVALAVTGGVLVIAGAVLLLAVGHSLTEYFADVSPVQRAYLLSANGGSVLPLALRV